MLVNILVTKPLMLPSAALRLNAKSDFGEIAVEVRNAAGQVLARSEPVQHDGLNLPIERQEEFQTPNQPVVLHFTLKNAKLFAIWCQ